MAKLGKARKARYSCASGMRHTEPRMPNEMLYSPEPYFKSIPILDEQQ